MAADDRGAGLLDPPHLRERLQLRVDIPGVAGRGIGIEILAQADRVRSEQELAVAVEADQRAERARRMSRQRHQHDAGIAEQILLAIHRLDRLSVVPIGPEIARVSASGAFAASISLA